MARGQSPRTTEDIPAMNPKTFAPKRAFTLIELMVSLAIAGVVFAAASSSVVVVIKTLKKTEKQIQVDLEAKILAEYLSSQLRVIGGGALRPWHGVELEENWNGDGSDRLTVLELASENDSECVITDHNNGAAIKFDRDDCCIDNTWSGKHLLVASKGAEKWLSLFSTGVNISPGASCQIVDPGGNGLGKSKPTHSAGETPDFTGGTLVAVRVKRYWLDAATHQLKLDISADNANNFETQVLADNVFDLQFALGYDVVPVDGAISDTGSVNDEWLGNATGDILGADGLLNAQEHELRMLQVGVAVGGKIDGMSGRAQILNGPEHTLSNGLLRTVGATVYLRNSNHYF